jgi:hypothetical protein
MFIFLLEKWSRVYQQDAPNECTLLREVCLPLKVMPEDYRSYKYSSETRRLPLLVNGNQEG